MYGGDSQAVEHRTTPSILYLSRTGTLLYIYISRHSSHWPSPYKYKSTSVASALAILSHHTDFLFTFCFMLFILHHTLHILHFISQRPGGLINLSIGTEHVYDLFKGIGGLDDIHRLLSKNSAYICKTAHVYCLFRGIGELDGIHRLLSENSAYICKTAHVYCLFRGIGGLDDIHRLLSENSAYT